MAEIDVNAYATTAANVAATTPSVIETKQPAGTGALRQVMTLGDPTTRANMQKVTAAGQGQVTTLDVATTGSLAALNAVVATAVNSQGIVAIQLTGTWVGTITFQGTEDPAGVAAASTSWFNVNGVASVSGLQLTNVTSNGQFRVNSGGYTAVRAIMTAFTSGSATAWVNASLAPSMATLAEPLPVGTNPIGKVAVDQTTNIIAGTIMQNAAVAVGNGTNLNVQGYVSALISITGTMSAGSAITFEASVDDVNFVAITAHQIGFAGNLTTITISTGDFRFSCAGYKSIRARISTYGAGTITAKGYVSALAGHPTTINSNIIAALPAGTNSIGSVNMASKTTGGLTTFTLISAATTNATSVKATAGTVYSIQASNTGAAVAFLKLFNLAVAPTVGTSVAVKSLIIPAGGGIVLSSNDIGIAFTTGISFSTTALLATADTTAVALSQVAVNIDYV